ncbi:tetratricopeptide repeat protein, partial [Stenotrophomonas maltophilia]|uniref:tetratricopeptide repeat protein n=1 Tax=Stenotrophomonas maltophilia TaxID=40324 RepID=UPI0013D9A8A8
SNASSASPNLAAAHDLRARTLAALGRHREALRGFERALAIEPRNIEMLCNRGTALSLLDRQEEAIEAFEQGLAIDPGQVELLTNLGASLFRL